MTKIIIPEKAKFLNVLTKEELDIVLPFLEELHFKANKIVVRQGKPSTGLYIIQKGEVYVSNRLFGNKLMILASLKQGDLFGEVGLIEGGAASATVSTITKMQCLYLSSVYFEAMQIILPTLSDKICSEIVSVLCERIRLSKSELRLPFEAIQANQFTFKWIDSVRYIQHHKVTETFIQEHKILMERVGLLHYFTEMELHVFYKYIDYVEIKRGKILCHEGDPSDGSCYLVLYGSLQAVMKYSDKTIKFGVVGPKDFLGQVEYFDNNPCLLTYIAREDSTLLRFNVRLMNEMRNVNNLVHFKCKKLIYHALGKMLRVTANQLIRINGIMS